MKTRFFIPLLSFTLVTIPADITKGGFGATQNSGATHESATETPKPPKGADTKPELKRNSYPFHGTLSSVDSSGKSLTLAGKQKPRVILITSDTRFFRNGAKVKLSDAIAGERVTGTVRKNAAGQEEAITVRYGGTESARK